MQCTYCGEQLEPAAEVCPICEGPAPSPLGSPATRATTLSRKKKTRKDISWVVCLLIALPIVAVDWMRLSTANPDNFSFAIGQLTGHALMAVIAGAIISRFAETRARLTWVVTFAVVVFMTMAQALGANMAAGGTAPESASSAPLTPPDIVWPAGWTPPSTTGMPGVKGVLETATFEKDGHRIAGVTIILFRNRNGLSLADQTENIIKGSSDTMAKNGMTSSFSTPTETTWLRRPALQYDASMKKDVPMHERSLVTQGPSSTTCNVSYFASDADFARHLPEFENIKSQFSCP